MRVKDVIPYIVIPGFIVVAGLSYFDFSKNNPHGQLALVSGQTGNYCQGYGDDRDYLYNPLTNIFTKTDGTESFTSTRRSDNKVLRQSFSNERFYIDQSNGALDISYDIVENCGGVDVVYTVSNPTAQNQTPPYLRIEGVMQRTSGDFFLLDTRDTGYVRNIKKTDGSISNIFLGSVGRENIENASNPIYRLTYPNFYYSPTVVAHDTDFTAGSALLYPHLQYKHQITPQLTKETTGVQAGTWRHEYREFFPQELAQLIPGESRTYTVTLRFTSPRYWLLTLDPYKKYFRQTYGALDQAMPQDLRPVYGVGITNEQNFHPVTNPRSYRLDSPYSSLVTGGWGTFVDAFIAEVQSHGFERSMIWSPSGMYSQNVTCPAGNDGQGCNYPPAFMDFLPNLTATADELDRLNQNNIDLGFWWGRAIAVPVPIMWDPPTLVETDYSNQSHLDFLDGQLLLAYERGTKIIGLDAYQAGPVYEKYYRLDHMKQITNNDILFVHEGSGPDILHKKIGNVVYDPMQYRYWWTQFDKTGLPGPDVLSRYLNSGAEIWFIHDRPPFCGGTEVEKVYSWGYTPVYFGVCAGQYPVDLPDLELEQLACFDGEDNDNDNRTDWPYDPGCDSPMDTNEYTPNEIDTRQATGGPGDDNGSGPSGPSVPNEDSRNVTYGSYSRQSLLRQIQELLLVLQALQSQIALNQAYTPVSSPVTTPVAPVAPRPTPAPVAPPNPSPATPYSGRWNSTPNNFSTDLSVGSTGSQVEALQRFLVSRGLLVLSSDGFGTYGPLTRDAVARFQYFTGISPADGVFNTETRNRMNQF